MTHRNLLLACTCYLAFVSPVWAVDSGALEDAADNSGKQIAALTTVVPVSSGQTMVKTGKTAQPASHAGKVGSQQHKHWSSIEIPLPADVKDALDACLIAGCKVGGVVGNRANELRGYLAELMKQLNSPPAITPAGSPYGSSLVPKQNPRLYLTNEGRLKTVSDR